jgi:hypothetical protein
MASTLYIGRFGQKLKVCREADDGNQRTEDRRQGTEDRRQRTEGRRQRAEDRRQTAEGVDCGFKKNGANTRVNPPGKY